MRSTKLFTISYNPDLHLPPLAHFIEAGRVVVDPIPRPRTVEKMEMVVWFTEADADDQEEMGRILDFMLDFATPSLLNSITPPLSFYNFNKS